MKIKFKQDYTGRETAMKEYKAGEQADLPTAQALELVRLNVAREMWVEIGKLYDPKPMDPKIPPLAIEEAQPATAKPRKGKRVKSQ